MLFFTKLARLFAYLGTAFGVLRVLMALTIAEEWLGPYRESLARYAPTSASSGELIDRGLYTILIAVALGVLTEISQALHK
jgi:hypothetical protein